MSEPIRSALLIFVPAGLFLAAVLYVVSLGAAEIQRDADACRAHGLRPVKGYNQAIECVR